jgi:hypothetical protein
VILNPKERLANKALVHSKGVFVCRRAYCRAKARRDQRFWFVWEEKHMESMVSAAKLLERLLTVQQAATEGWKMWQENHSP